MSKVTAEQVLKVAQKYIGVTEYPPNSNNVLFNTAYYGKKVSGSSYPWCAVFQWYIFKEAGASDLFCGGQKCAYTPSIDNFYKNKGKAFTTPKVGDLALFKFPGSSRINHIGIVESIVSPTKVVTIEGNTSVGNDSNGGAVMRRTRTTNYIVHFCRPDYLEGSSTATNNTSNNNLYKQSTFIADVQGILGLDVNGVADNKLVSATVTISKSKNNKHRLVVPIQKYLKALGYYSGKIDGDAGNLFDKAVKGFQSKWTKKPDGEITAKGTTWKKLFGLI